MGWSISVRPGLYQISPDVTASALYEYVYKISCTASHNEVSKDSHSEEEVKWD